MFYETVQQLWDGEVHGIQLSVVKLESSSKPFLYGRSHDYLHGHTVTTTVTPFTGFWRTTMISSSIIIAALTQIEDDFILQVSNGIPSQWHLNAVNIIIFLSLYDGPQNLYLEVIHL